MGLFSYAIPLAALYVPGRSVPKPIKDLLSTPWGLCSILEPACYIFAHELRTVFSDFSAAEESAE